MVSKRKGPVKLVTPPPSSESDGETIIPEEPIGEKDDKRCDEENHEVGVEEENLGSKEDEHNNQGEEDGNKEPEEIEAENGGSEEEEHINQEEEEGNKESEESDDDEQPMEPPGMYFSPSEYCKSIRVGSRCRLKATLAFMKPYDEVQWFEDHSQFRHVFHMPEEGNHMSQGFLMLLLHTAKTAIDSECWFVVNGVPIRYSIREHALLTKFACNDYPEGYDPTVKVSDEDLQWAKRVFGKVAVKINDVREKLGKKSKKLKDGDRKKLLILLFLSEVIAAKAKGNGKIDHFLLRMANDVDASNTFPWGRYTFESNLKGIKSILRNMKGKVEEKKLKNFSGFITPLEILAFEAIPQLACRFRQPVTAENVCGRMCKSKFKSSMMKGFPLDDINEELGRLKDITSILEPDDEEKVWLPRIVEDVVDAGVGLIDPVVNMWKDRLIGERKKIFWKHMYDADVEGRSGQQTEEEKVEKTGVGVGEDIQSLKETMDKGFQQIMDMLGDQNGRIQKLEVSVSELLTWKEGEKVPPPYQCDDDMFYGRKAYEEHVSPKETDENVSPKTTEENVSPKTPEENVSPKAYEENVFPKTPEENVSPKAYEENVFAGTSGGDTSQAIVVYGEDTTMGTAVEDETQEYEAVEEDEHNKKKKATNKEGKKNKGRCNEKKKEKKKKRDEDDDEDLEPAKKREKVPSKWTQPPYTALKKRGIKKK